MATTYPVRPFRSAVISSKVLTAGTAYGTTAVHSVVSYAAGGTITTTQFDPTHQSGTTTSANRAPPAAGGAKTDWGWRADPAVSAVEGIDVPAGTWTVTIRYLRSGVSLEVAIDGIFTVVAYQTTSAGTQVKEIGRGTSGIVASIGTAAATTTVPIDGTATSFQGDDRVQYEVYFQAYRLGIPAAPVAQTNIWVNFEGAAGNTCELTSAPAYSPHVYRSVTTTPTVAMARQVVANRTVTVTTTPTTALRRALTKIPLTVTAAPTVGLRLDIPEAALDRLVLPTDFAGSSPTKTISGVIRDSAGTPYVGATVKLVRESDGFIAAVTTSGADGAYSFTRDAADTNTYLVLAWEDTGTPTQGISARALTPV